MLNDLISALTFLFISQIEAANYHLILTKGEKYPLMQNSLLIPFNEKEFNQSQVQNQSLILATEYEKYSFQGLQTLFTVISDNKELIYIYSNFNSRIQKQFKVKNYINDDQIIIEKLTSIPFTVNQTDCTFMHKIKDSVFLLQCQKNKTHSVFIILNEEEKVLFYELIIQIFDQLILYENENCNKVSQYKFETLLFYGTRCIQSIMYLIDIDPTTFQFYPEFKNTTFSGESLLLEIEYCRQVELQLVYLDYLKSYNLQTKQFSNLTQDTCPNNEVNKFNFYNDDFFQNLNLKIQIPQIESSIEVNNNQILFLENQIILINNQYLHQTLDQKFLLINSLYNLPFFVSLTESSDIIFYKVNQYNAFLQYQDSQFVAAFAIYNCNLQIKDFNIYQIDLYDIQNPKIIIKQNIDLDYSAIKNHIPINIISLQLGAPIMLNSFQIDNQKFQYNQYDQIVLCMNNFNLTNNFKILFQQKNPIAFIYKDNDWFIKIQDCKGLKQTRLNDSQNAVFYVSKTQPLFLLVMKRILRVGKLEKNLDIEFLKEFQFDQDIISTKQAQNALIFYFQNCTVYSINFDLSLLLINLGNLPAPCTEVEAFQRQQKLYRQGSSIIVGDQSNQQFRSTIQGTILSTEQFSTLLLIFSLSSKSIITINKYSTLWLILFYTIPTYQYTIKYPLSYVMSQSYLVIVALLDDKSEALLVYNVKDSAANCLKAIIPIDKGNNNFGVISLEFIYFVKNGTISMQKLNELIISIPLVHEFEIFDVQQILYLNLASQLDTNSNQISQIKLKYYNSNYTLRYRQNMKVKYLSLNEKNEIQGLNAIFGGIDEIVSEDSQCSIKAPLINTNISFLCDVYMHRCCYNNLTLNCDHFGQQVILQLHHLIKEIKFVEYTDNGFLLIFIDYSNDQFQLSYSNLTVQIQKLPNLLINHQWLFKISRDRYFLKLNDEFVVLHLGSDTLLRKYYIPSLNQDYRFINLGLDGVCIFSEGKNSLIMNKIDFSNQSKQLYITENNSNFIKFDIFGYSYSKYMLSINYILVSKLNLVYLVTIIVNSDSMKVANETISRNNIRLNFSHNYQQFIFADKKKVLMLVDSKNFQNKYLRLFQFDQQTEIIDHIFSYEIPINGSIEEHNSTHLAQIQQINHQKIINLIEIGNYKIECQKYSEKGYMVTILNNVSQMKTSVTYFQNKFKVSIIDLILILNLGLIIIMIQQIPKRYKRIKRN